MAAMLGALVRGGPVTSFVGRGSWGIVAHGDLISGLISLMAPLLLIASLCIVAGASCPE
jgi:hypothetical protein